MSTVTNIILTTGLDESKAIESINCRYRHGLEEAIVRVFQTYSAVHYNVVGGNKELECGVYVSAMNNLDTKQLIELVETVKWNDPTEVQLFLKEQDDDIFTQVELDIEERI